MINKDRNYYHYTTQRVIQEIISSKTIKLATAGVYVKNEKPIAWVSCNPEWEHSATKMARSQDGKVHQLKFEDQLLHFGCARIQIEPDCLLNWNSLKKIAKINSNTAQQLEIKGRMMGSKPSEWFGSIKPIGLENWIKVEVYENGEWIETVRFKMPLIL